MLRLGRMTDYALAVLAALARDPARTLSAAEVAQRTDLPDTTAAKLLKTLAQAGLVRSHRGRGGGYSLDRAASAVTVGEVVRIMEGPVALVDCFEDGADGPCERVDACVVQAGLARVNDRMREALDGLTLAEMMAGAPLPADGGR